MKQQKFYAVLTCLLVAYFAIGAPAFADDIKARMKQRLPIIIDLKASGIVGENNKGYLDFVGGKKEKADIVAAENKDRNTVYKAIAKQQGTTVDLVGQHRARQIALKANSGEWLQDANGNWYQK